MPIRQAALQGGFVVRLARNARIGDVFKPYERDDGHHNRRIVSFLGLSVARIPAVLSRGRAGDFGSDVSGALIGSYTLSQDGVKPFPTVLPAIDSVGTPLRPGAIVNTLATVAAKGKPQSVFLKEASPFADGVFGKHSLCRESDWIDSTRVRRSCNRVP